MANETSTFLDQIQETLKRTENLTSTENGANGFKSTGKALLDLNFKLASLRDWSIEGVEKEFEKAYNEDKLLALKWLFFARDIREGAGERRTFKLCCAWLILNHKEVFRKLIKLIPEYGRWEDLLKLFGFVLKLQRTEHAEKTGDLIGDFMKVIRSTLKDDIQKMQDGKSISLLAKWLPSANTSSNNTRWLAKHVIKFLGLTERQYRKTLSALRKHIDVVERKMSSNNWKEIDYSKVPSRASLIYSKAFKKHDEEGYNDFLRAVSNGEKKINAGTLFPHEILVRYMERYWGDVVGYNEELEALWKALPNTVEGDQRILVVPDGSGSMYSSIGGSRVQAIHCAIGLAIYFSERLSKDFKDKFITFSRYPRLVNLANIDSLHDKIEKVREYDDISRTNIEAVFDLILTTAINNKVDSKDLPNIILIISDMEFNSGSENWNESLFESISKKFENNGYTIPKLAFWSICSRTNAIPLTKHKSGVSLISGFSTNLIKMVMSGQLDPYKALVDVLNSERYSPIEECLR